jgi:hypothetical protein
MAVRMLNPRAPRSPHWWECRGAPGYGPITGHVARQRSESLDGGGVPLPDGWTAEELDGGPAVLIQCPACSAIRKRDRDEGARKQEVWRLKREQDAACA